MEKALSVLKWLLAEWLEGSKHAGLAEAGVYHHYRRRGEWR